MLCNGCTHSIVLPAASWCRLCGAGVTSVSYQLCESCSNQLCECRICRAPVAPAAPPPPPVKPGTFFVKKDEKSNGGSTSLKPGEQLHITLPEDRWGKQWRPGSVSSWGVVSLTDSGQFTPDPGDYQHGTRTIIYTASSSGTSRIDIDQTDYAGNVTQRAAWSITVKVK